MTETPNLFTGAATQMMTPDQRAAAIRARAKALKESGLVYSAPLPRQQAVVPAEPGTMVLIKGLEVRVVAWRVYEDRVLPVLEISEVHTPEDIRDVGWEPISPR